MERGRPLHCLPAFLQRPGPSRVSLLSALLSVGGVRGAGGPGQVAAAPPTPHPGGRGPASASAPTQAQLCL